MDFSIGSMAMPADFRYREVFLAGKPQHDTLDGFRLRHPSMDAGRRAKIFSPFDALRGFSEAIASKDVQYCERVEPCEDDLEELNRRLCALKSLTRSSRAVRENRVRISVTRFVLCTDRNSEAYGRRGQYVELQGICRGVDGIYGRLYVDDTAVPFRDILSLDSPDGIFEPSDCGEY